MNPKPNLMTANDWRNELQELYLGLKAGTIKVPAACELNNTVGKVIALTKLELDYAYIRKKLGTEAPTIPLLENRSAA